MPVKGRLWPGDDDDEELGSDEEKSIAPKIRAPHPKKSVLSCLLNGFMRWCSPVCKRCKKSTSCYFAITRMVYGRRLCANNKGKQRRGFSKEHKLINTFKIDVTCMT